MTASRLAPAPVISTTSVRARTVADRFAGRRGGLPRTSFGGTSGRRRVWNPDPAVGSPPPPRARLSWRLPPRLSRMRWIWPELAGIGATPASAAKASRERKRVTSPASPRSFACLLKHCDPARPVRRTSCASERSNRGMVIRKHVAHATRRDFRVISGCCLDRPERVHACCAAGIDSKRTVRRRLDARMATGPDGRLLEGVHRHVIRCNHGGATLNDDPCPFRCGHGHLTARQHVPLTRDVNDGLLLGGHERRACHTNASSVTSDDLVPVEDHEGAVTATHHRAHPLRR